MWFWIERHHDEPSESSLSTPDASPSPMSTHVTGNIIGSLVVTGNSNRVSVGRFHAGHPKRR